MAKGRLVVMDNDLLRASYKLELTEQRLVASLVSRIESSISEVRNFKTGVVVQGRDGQELDSREIYSIGVGDFAREWGIPPSDARKDLLKATNVLFKREFTVKITDKKTRKFHWVQMVEYDREADTIGVRWTEDIIPYISQLACRFTKIPLEEYVELRSTYSWRLKDIMLSRAGEVRKKDVEFGVKELMQMLCVPESRLSFGALNAKVIKPAVKELVKSGMKELKVEYRKKGREVIGVVFNWETEEERRSRLEREAERLAERKKLCKA